MRAPDRELEYALTLHKCVGILAETFGTRCLTSFVNRTNLPAYVLQEAGLFMCLSDCIVSVSSHGYKQCWLSDML